MLMPPESATQKRKKVGKEQLRNVAPLLWELVRSRRTLLVLGFLLMIVNRVSGLVLPYSTRFLIDNVVMKHHAQLLKPAAISTAYRRSGKTRSTG